MSNECLRSEKEHDVRTAASERGPDQTTDATRTQDRVSHTSDRKPERSRAFRRRHTRRRLGEPASNEEVIWTRPQAKIASRRPSFVRGAVGEGFEPRRTQRRETVFETEP